MFGAIMSILEVLALLGYFMSEVQPSASSTTSTMSLSNENCTETVLQ